MDDYDIEERCRQIVVLLAYPNVGSLSPAALALNLGTTEHDIRSAIQSLLREGSIVLTSDGRLAASSTLSPQRTAGSGPPDYRGRGNERKERE